MKSTIALLALSAGSFAAAPAEPPAIPDLRDKLVALDGATAWPYFLLAEEVSAEMHNAKGIDLARTLFVLAHEIDRTEKRPEGLSRSVYLALAPLADRPEERAWLLALAGIAPREGAATMEDPEGALIVAEAFGAAHGGEEHELKQMLENPKAQGALERLRRADPVAAGILQDAASDSACPLCHNRRILKQTTLENAGGADETYVLCTQCGGNPGPSLTAERFARSVAAECILVGAAHRSWSAQTWVAGGVPFHDPDPEELARHYRVDPEARRWRPDASDDIGAGAWVTR